MSRKGKKSKRPNQQNIIQQELSVSDQQKLSTKFQNIFDKQVLSEYENDNYVECIKQCDRILSQYPKNGETLAMKGLCLHCQGIIKDDDDDDDDNNEEEEEEKNEEEKKLKLRMEGLQLITQGLKYNLKSSICWRVKGLAHKSDKDYESAIVCYKKASVYDKQNQRIYTDLASLQIQLKKFNEFRKTRQEIWFLNQDKSNCIAYVISLYLNNEFDKCLTIINDDLLIQTNTHKFTPINDTIEINEIYLLKTQILYKQNKFEKCLIELNDKLLKNLIVDKLSGLQLKLNCLLTLNKFDDATNTILQLIDKNPENLNYHKQYISLLCNENENTYNIYKNLQNKYPKCNTIKRVLLEECNNINEFEILLNDYLLLKFKKSVMSLYNDIRNLYKNENKGTIIDKLINNYRKELLSKSNITRNKWASPMCLLWVNYFYCSRLVDLYKFELALSIINETILIVPTCIELYVLKSRIYKYVGNRELAFKYLNYARKLDKADRYLNTKCVRYAFRCDKYNLAEEIVTLFLKKTEGTKSLNNLQVMWYQLHKAESHLLLNEYGPSIKQYQNVYNHFETFWKNQTDFHRYSYRKCAINSYTQLLQWEYTLRNHPFFIRAAKNAMFLWIKIYKLQKENKLKQLQFGSSKYNENDKKKHKQKDERGWKLIHCKNPLNKLKQWLNHLLPLINSNIYKQEEIHEIKDEETIICVYIVYIKYLLYTNQYKKIFENINIIKNKYSKFLINPYYIYNIIIFIFDDLKNIQIQQIQQDGQKKQFNQLIQEYNINFIKLYYQQHINDFNKIYCVLKCCLQFDEISKQLNNIGYSTNDIMNQMIKIGCNPLKCVQVRNELQNYNNSIQLLQTFEKYVKVTYPLQTLQEL